MRVIIDEGFELRVSRGPTTKTNRSGKIEMVTIKQVYYHGQYLGQIRESITTVEAQLGSKKATGTAVSWYVERLEAPTVAPSDMQSKFKAHGAMLRYMLENSRQPAPVIQDHAATST